MPNLFIGHEYLRCKLSGRRRYSCELAQYLRSRGITTVSS